MLDAIWYLIVLLIALVALSAFFSSSEIAFASVNKLRLKNAADNGDLRAKTAMLINENFPRFLSTVLIGNTLVNIAFSSVAAILSLKLFPKHADLVAGIGATVLLLIFGEIFPKIIGFGDATGIVYSSSPFIRFAMLVFHPITSAVSLMVDKLSPLWTPKYAEPTVTDEELVDILDTIEDEGVFTEREGELIRSAIEFSDVTAREILIPRVDMAAFDINDPLSELIEDKDMLSYSRIPIYDDSIDNIIGILSTKRLIKALIAEEEISLQDMLSEPVFVHMTRNISSILKELRQKQLQMAIVVDEFGGTMGVLTLEDIMEEIVGEIFDESDDVEQVVVSTSKDSYEVDGGLNIYDMFEVIGFDLRDFDSEYTTVGGWAVEMLDRFPVPGDSFSYKNLTVTVLEAESMRVEKVRVDIDRESSEDLE